jgi:hypothetical protein
VTFYRSRFFQIMVPKINKWDFWRQIEEYVKLQSDGDLHTQATSRHNIWQLCDVCDQRGSS